MIRRIVKFINDVRFEMTKVSWPTKDELLGSTYVVIILSIILALFIFASDTILTRIVGVLLG